ncbi:MAG: class GN sortase [Pseudomonadota bacterium]
MKWLALVFLCLGVTQLLEGTYLVAKAQVAQVLMQWSWQKGLAGEPTPPWPWADTHPVARLLVEDHDVDQIVLAGASGRNLAFGPGHLLASARLGENGNLVVAGHRDTHFSFLQDVQLGAEVQLKWIDGQQRTYEILHAQVVDSRLAHLDLSVTEETLTLVTCYPFDALTPRGPLRYIVVAKPLTERKVPTRQHASKPQMHEYASS